ncbi:glutathione S-transferase omega-1 [Amblyraja radiata]|uniref:glutathione S-transferase omega-1 n=1 Tax=Amblyraja radiata TaxID=386614 RepID=UPI00140385EE|nr:glutathione S-transferase omega-1 [Amblyraja radiata]
MAGSTGECEGECDGQGKDSPNFSPAACRPKPWPKAQQGRAQPLAAQSSLRAALASVKGDTPHLMQLLVECSSGFSVPLSSRYETININLLDKPDWFFEKNPLGLVPVLETSSNQLIYESPITCEFLDESYPKRRLLHADPYEKARQKMLWEHFSKVIGCIFKITMARKASEDTSKLEEEFQSKLGYFEQHLAGAKTRFFGGDSVTMTDYMLWPWFERLDALSVTNFLDLSPALGTWTHAMLEDAAVKATINDTQAYKRFLELYMQRRPEACD